MVADGLEPAFCGTAKHDATTLMCYGNHQPPTILQSILRVKVKISIREKTPKIELNIFRSKKGFYLDRGVRLNLLF